MFEKYFGLKANPFTIAPNPSYLYLSDQHREALAHLQYGLHENGGFILLTGEVGTGKTTLWRCLCEDMSEDIKLAVLLNPCFNSQELLEAICDEFSLTYPEDCSVRKLTESINHYLLEQHQAGKHCALIVEEAQNLSDALLEQLRLLTNLETNEYKLLQIILIGQPELSKKLEQPHLRQLKQRIIARYHLSPLSKKEVKTYVEHRLLIAGSASNLFTRDALMRLASKSEGIPRLINLICERALLGCYAQGKRQVNLRILNQAAHEVLDNPQRLSEIQRSILRWLGRRVWATAAIAAAVMAVAIWLPYLQSTTTALSTQVAQSWSAWTGSDDLPPEPANLAAQSGSTRLASNQAMPVVQVANWAQYLERDSRNQDPYQTLFQLWGIPLTDKIQQPPCQYALDYKLDCWHRRGEIESIKRVNRPAVLKMVSTGGKPFYATLVKIENGRLKMSAGNSAVLISENDLANVWTGEYTLFWKRPEGYRDTIYLGDKDNLVPWVAQKIAKVTGNRHLASSSKVYSAELQSNIRKFQNRCGLFADGLVGKETLITLNSAVSGKMPVLHRAKRCALKG